ncbi:MAG: arsenate reductase ArsC [Pseudomonadota bacterium]
MNILFLCTGNSARSVIGECLMTARGGPEHRGYSAGSQPVGRVNPGAERVLARHGIALDGVRSKRWDEFAGPDAVPMDAIITVCDNAAGETCPIWPGHPTTAHWGLPDPAAVAGDTDAIDAAFETTFAVLDRRVTALVDCLNAGPDSRTLSAALRELATVD